MGRKSAMPDVKKGQILAYKDDGLSTREITRRINRSPSVVNNCLNLELKYGTKKKEEICPKMQKNGESHKNSRNKAQIHEIHEFLRLPNACKLINKHEYIIIFHESFNLRKFVKKPFAKFKGP